MKKFSKISLVVIKFNSNQNNIIPSTYKKPMPFNKCMSMSKPCMNCIKIIKLFNMRNIYYSDLNGEIICEKVKNISSNHESQMFKHINDSTLY